jgi:uncharacterized protein (DUF3084 family)
LETTLQSAAEMTKDLVRLNHDLATSHDTFIALQLEKAKLEAKLHSALSKVRKISAERDQALSEKGAALTARDEVISDRDRIASKRDHALVEKSRALAIRDEAMSEREGAIEQLEKLQAQIFSLSK